MSAFTSRTAAKDAAKDAARRGALTGPVRAFECPHKPGYYHHEEAA